MRPDDAGSDFKGIHITRSDRGYPVLVGAATWQVFVAATATQATGYVVMIWAEIASPRAF